VKGVIYTNGWFRGWDPADISFRANALNSRGIVGAGNPGQGIQTDGHRGLTPSGRGINQSLSGGRFAVRS
jgi:hypothetical protein